MTDQVILYERRVPREIGEELIRKLESLQLRVAEEGDR